MMGNKRVSDFFALTSIIIEAVWTFSEVSLFWVSRVPTRGIYEYSRVVTRETRFKSAINSQKQ